MDQPDHDLVGDHRGDDGVRALPGALGDRLAEWVVRTSAAILEPLARADLGWLSRQAEGLVTELRGPGAAYVFQFWGVRFLLGLAEAGFYPGVIVYLTHWFPRRDRSRAWPGSSSARRSRRSSARRSPAGSWASAPATIPPVLGLVGWQWVYICLGHPGGDPGLRRAGHADRLAPPGPLAHRRGAHGTRGRAASGRRTSTRSHAGHMTVIQALAHPKVLALAAAYFFVVTGNYGVEFYMASILKDWYQLDVKIVAGLIVIPPIGSLIGQVFVGWNSDRTRERRWHASLPIVFGAIALALTPGEPGHALADRGPVHPGDDRAEGVPAGLLDPAQPVHGRVGGGGSIGLINSFGNLGGWVGPTVVGVVRQYTELLPHRALVPRRLDGRLGVIIVSLGIGRKVKPAPRAQATLASRWLVRHKPEPSERVFGKSMARPSNLIVASRPTGGGMKGSKRCPGSRASGARVIQEARRTGTSPRPAGRRGQFRDLDGHAREVTCSPRTNRPGARCGRAGP